MNEKKKESLVKIADQAVTATVRKQQPQRPCSDDAKLNEHCGCFVTLKNHGRLRGCLGQFIANKPLIETVSRMAASAATADSRFFDDPITVDELDELDIEISVLSPLKKTDDPMSLRLGVDGIYIKKGFASGCFLPQVATETGWNKEEFLSYCCAHKASLRPDAWKDDDTEVFLFTAEILK